MSKAAKIVLITAIILVVTGIGLTVVGAITAAGKGGLGGGKYTKQETVVTDKFSNIDVSEVSADVVFKPSADGQVKIEYYDNDNYKHKIDVSGDTLKIVYKDEDNTPWWLRINIGNWWNTSTEEIVTTVYIPAGEYGSLNVSTVSGDVNVPGDYSFDGTVISTVSGDVSALCKMVSGVNVNTTSGNITAANVSGSGVDFNTISGEVSLSGTSVSGTVDIDTTSGDVTLTNVTAGTTKVSTVSGEVTVTAINADNIDISTTSGDVKGTVAGEHEFDVDTTSGDISLPSNIKGMPLVSVDTVSGDVALDSVA